MIINPKKSVIMKWFGSKLRNVHPGDQKDMEDNTKCEKSCLIMSVISVGALKNSIPWRQKPHETSRRYRERTNEVD